MNIEGLIYVLISLFVGGMVALLSAAVFYKEIADISVISGAAP